MTTLVFIDRGWTVLTNHWTVASKRDGETEIAYLWNSEGVAKATLDLDITLVLQMLGRGGPIVDLRPHQRG